MPTRSRAGRTRPSSRWRRTRQIRPYRSAAAARARAAGHRPGPYPSGSRQLGAAARPGASRTAAAARRRLTSRTWRGRYRQAAKRPTRRAAPRAGRAPSRSRRRLASRGSRRTAGQIRACAAPRPSAARLAARRSAARARRRRIRRVLGGARRASNRLRGCRPESRSAVVRRAGPAGPIAPSAGARRQQAARPSVRRARGSG